MYVTKCELDGNMKTPMKTSLSEKKITASSFREGNIINGMVKIGSRAVSQKSKLVNVPPPYPITGTTDEVRQLRRTPYQKFMIFL